MFSLFFIETRNSISIYIFYIISHTLHFLIYSDDRITVLFICNAIRVERSAHVALVGACPELGVLSLFVFVLLKQGKHGDLAGAWDDTHALKLAPSDNKWSASVDLPRSAFPLQ